jgi:hypothetical protein
VERLISPAESDRAVATTIAIEALPQLSTKHLDLLGLVALIYHIGPVIRAVQPEHLLDSSSDAQDDERGEADEFEAKRLAAAYMSWLDQSSPSTGHQQT